MNNRTPEVAIEHGRDKHDVEYDPEGEQPEDMTARVWHVSRVTVLSLISRFGSGLVNQSVLDFEFILTERCGQRHGVQQC